MKEVERRRRGSKGMIEVERWCNKGSEWERISEGGGA